MCYRKYFHLQVESNLTNLGYVGFIPNRYGVLVVVVRVHHNSRGLACPSRVNVCEWVLLRVDKAFILFASGVCVTIIAELALVPPSSNHPFSILSVYYRVLESQ